MPPMDVDAVLFIVRKDLKGAPVARQREVADKADVAWSVLRRAIDGDENFHVETIRKLHRYYFENGEQAAPQQVAWNGEDGRQMGGD